jgi:hypothetical protein
MGQFMKSADVLREFKGNWRAVAAHNAIAEAALG